MTMSHPSDVRLFELALLRLLCPDARPATAAVETSFKQKFRRRNSRRERSVDWVEWLPRPSQIVVQEVLSGHTLSVCWSDSQTGHYVDQIWRLGLARVEGACALSGRPIAFGDRVFRPRRTATCVPGNWNRMILASAVFDGFDRCCSQDCETGTLT